MGQKYWIYLLVMAGVTYLIRVIPFVLCKKKIENQFIQSFLTYVPYAVLGCMTFPAIFESTASFPSALIGTCVAIVLAFYRKGLVTVAVSACITVYIVELLMRIGV
jgi:branched-subunit amino acid transport protein